MQTIVTLGLPSDPANTITFSKSGEETDGTPQLFGRLLRASRDARDADARGELAASRTSRELQGQLLRGGEEAHRQSPPSRAGDAPQARADAVRTWRPCLDRR